MKSFFACRAANRLIEANDKQRQTLNFISFVIFFLRSPFKNQQRTKCKTYTNKTKTNEFRGEENEEDEVKKAH